MTFNKELWKHFAKKPFAEQAEIVKQKVQETAKRAYDALINTEAVETVKNAADKTKKNVKKINKKPSTRKPKDQ